jgi:hypothetical protein
MVEIKIAKHSKEHSFLGTVFVIVQSTFAVLLVTVAVAFILLWLMSVVLSFTSNSGLMPWTASGVSTFGLFFIFLATIPGIPGLIWVNRLVDHATSPVDRILKITAWVGRVAFYVGTIAAILTLVLGIISAVRQVGIRRVVPSLALNTQHLIKAGVFAAALRQELRSGSPARQCPHRGASGEVGRRQFAV